jgi:hypothetical protein
MLALVGAFQFGTAINDANAWVVVRRPIAPVRRVVARTVLPPYPVARRVVFGPPAFYGPAYYGPAFYGPGVYVGF